MNYQKLYNLLIESRKKVNKQKTIYTERHHIIPRCLGGTNNADNIVVLTCREHYIAHLLLSKIYPSKRSIQQSFLMMGAKGNNKSTQNRRVVSHTYEFAKKRFIDSISGKNHHYYGKSREEHVKQAISKYRTGKIPVIDSNGNRYEVTKDDPRYISGEVWHHSKGIKLTDDHKNKIALKSQGKSNPRYSGMSDDEIVEHAINFYKLSGEIWYACKWNEYSKDHSIPLHFSKFRFVERSFIQSIEDKLGKKLRKKRFYVVN